ncbi:immunoglobulin-like domain-containing protein [Ructibacterium gallinarum]|uniref:Atrophied bacterial Ig domain-containing protein n=1 Tax=Ructibacterium gallinarum TaxID=2779355 RepID=A0A9D5M7G5_9FIRM|nr:immunoglobulin-like domain-containing protein [Ructibacterium gallinarum]MBE5040954.1 hypothetical protein [Ructibacterium gallinarum]
MKKAKKLISVICVFAFMATLFVWPSAVTAANPNEISYDFTTQAGIDASGQGAVVSFDAEKNASKFTGAFNAYFTNADSNKNVRITEMEFEYNTQGGLSLQMRNGSTSAVLGNPLGIADNKDIIFVYLGSETHGLTVEDGHKYRLAYVYDYVTQYITGLAWDLTGEEEELLFCNTTTYPSFATFGGYKIEPISGFDGWIYNFKSYELSQEEYRAQPWHEGLVHFDYTKYPTWSKNLRWAANFGNQRQEVQLADSSTISAMAIKTNKESYFNKDEKAVTDKRIEWNIGLVIPESSGMEIQGTFGPLDSSTGRLSSSLAQSLVNFQDGKIYFGDSTEAGTYTASERIWLELAIEAAVGTYTATVKNQTGETIASIEEAKDLPEGAIGQINLIPVVIDTVYPYITELQLDILKGEMKHAEPQSDGSFLIANFLDQATCNAWGKGPGNDKLPTISFDRGVYLDGIGYEMDFATDTGGSYMSNKPESFYGLDFSDYSMLRISFTLTVSKPGTTTPEDRDIDNYFTVVLSTGEEAGYFETYKQNECLTYEIPMAEQEVNQKVELILPLDEFVTQFDGMSGGVQGEKDGITPLSDIKSISILGASMAKSEVGGVGNGPDVWAITNSKWSSNQTCGLRLHQIDLVTGASLANNALAEHMAQYTEKPISAGPISLPGSITGGTVEWSSDHPEIIASDGTFQQPAESTVVMLTAAITGDDLSQGTGVYYIGVKGTNAASDYMIADFTIAEQREQWQKWSSDMQSVGQAVDTDGGYYYYRRAAYATGGGYLSNNPALFAALDFSDYKALKLDLSIQSERVINNYFTIVLSTSENPGKVFNTDECIAIEVDISKLPIGSRTSVYLPFSEFITEFDGMSGGVQGTADGITDLSEIRSISLYPGAARPNPWNGIGATSEQFHLYTDWAFKESSGADNVNSCTMHLYSIEALVDAPTEFDVYTENGTALADLDSAAAVHGAVTLSAVPADKEVYTMTALYHNGLLVDSAVQTSTVGEGYVETPQVNFDPAIHDKIAVYIWDSNFKPLLTHVVKE